MTNPITPLITMKDKLYDFLYKRRTFIQVLMIAGGSCLLLTPATNKPIFAAALAFAFVPMFAWFFLIIEFTNRDHKKALQLWQDQRNSSSPKWDGHVCYPEDIEPRLRLLRNRIAQDQAEIDNIERVIKS